MSYNQIGRDYDDNNIEAQGWTQGLRGPMTRARVKKVEKTPQQVVVTNLEVIPIVKEIDPKLFQYMIIIEDPWAGECYCWLSSFIRLK